MEQKDKQIEEIGKAMCKHFIEEVCSKLDCKKDCKYYGKENCKTCIHEEICQLRTFSYCEEEVKEKGCVHYQPKIDKDSVVLSREEYESLKEEIKRLDQERLELQVDNNMLYLQLDNKSKETAEKILNEILNFINFETFRQGYEFKKIQNKLKEIATREGIEIKE